MVTVYQVGERKKKKGKKGKKEKERERKPKKVNPYGPSDRQLLAINSPKILLPNKLHVKTSNTYSGRGRSAVHILIHHNTYRNCIF